MKVSVIIVNYNVKYFLEVCLCSCAKALENIDHEIIVVDNNSQDGSIALVKEKFPEVITIANNDNKGFSKANNQAVAIAKGEYILFLNPDTVLPEDFFLKTLPYIDAHPDVGSIGPRLIDGKGQFAPDAKKSFPTLSVALFKATGLNKLFPKSPYYNKYYAVDIGEFETAKVESLSGCCMMMRSKAIQEAGGAFDEDYFMYFEDGDLCYRIRKAGYVNIYFPETSVIHYKGESTRKTTLSYVKIFNEAFAIFARKHYGKQNAKAFIFFINIGIVLRAILSVFKTVLKFLKMPLFDAIIMFLTLWFVKEFWTEEVKGISPIEIRSIYLTFPAYIGIWVFSLFLNGTYDQPYRGIRVVRGLLFGTVFCLAYYGLLPPELRYSRAIIVITAAASVVFLLALHELLYRLGIFKFTPYDALPNKAVIVAEEKDYHKTEAVLDKVHYAPEIYGRISTHENVDEYTALTNIRNMRPLLYTVGINEVIFCVNGLSYKEVIDQMQYCGGNYEYKIHLADSQSFVGSNSSHTSGDLYVIDRRFNLSQFAQKRNKKVVDIFFALLFLFCLPVLAFFVKSPGAFFSNIWLVFTGQRTWVGYRKDEQEQTYLPPISPSVLPPYNILENFEPSQEVKAQMNIAYAQHYNVSHDINFIIKNFRFIGIKS